MANRDLRQLERRLRDVAEQLERSIPKLIGDIGEEVGTILVPATPVDTGRARANWRPSVNVPATQPVTLLDPTGAATVSRIRNVARGVRLGDTLYIVNRVSYIVPLNRGSSPQAEAGFVEAAVNEGVRVGLRRFAAEGLG